jgi:hypothetical protein
MGLALPPGRAAQGHLLRTTPFGLVNRALQSVPASGSWLVCVGYPGYLAGSWITQWTGYRRSTLCAGFLVGVLGGGGATLVNLAAWWIAPGWWFSLDNHGDVPLAQMRPGFILSTYTATAVVITLFAAFWPGYKAGMRILLRSVDEPPPDADAAYTGTMAW